MLPTMLHRTFLSVVVSVGGALVLPAQSLELDVSGGSLPGILQLTTYPGAPAEFVMFIPSALPGPTPVSLLDPNDPRQVDIGIDLLGLAWLGVTGLDGRAEVPVPLGSAPALQDLPLYLQAVTFQFGATILDRISNPNQVRFGIAGTFRDRFVSFVNDRAFATVLPRSDRRWMVAGGARGQLLAQVATATTEIYDPRLDSFSPGPSLTTPRSLHTQTELGNGTFLITGGVNMTNDPQASCEIYDPVADTFTAVAPMGTPRTGHTATLLSNGRVLVTGGIQAMPVTPTQLQPIREIVATTEIYDPVTNTWAAGPNLATPRAGHVAITRPDGRVLFAGGISWDPNILFGWLPAVRRSCDLYNPANNTMGTAPQMAVARSLIDPVDLGSGRWLLAGGINGITIIPFNPGNPTAAAEIYDAVANTWTTVGSMATARGNQKGWAIGNGQFLLAGGANGSILSPTALSSTEIFSTATNTFGPGPALSTPRAGAAAFPTPHGQVQLFGGASSGTTISNTTEWYFF
jgi:Galactose oxidase, central domain/Kelch motif